jgi:hypothetical protein
MVAIQEVLISNGGDLGRPIPPREAAHRGGGTSTSTIFQTFRELCTGVTVSALPGETSALSPLEARVHRRSQKNELLCTDLGGRQVYCLLETILQYKKSFFLSLLSH